MTRSERPEFSLFRAPVLGLPVLAFVLAPFVIAGGEVRESLSREVVVEPGAAARDAERRGGEALHLRWKLGGFLGPLAGLFVPSKGDALLTLVPGTPEKTVELQLLVTAPKREGEYFLYGAEVRKDTGTTSSVWNSQFFRGEVKSKEQDIDETDVIDFASVVYYLRTTHPARQRRVTIWNGGKTYPVEVKPLDPQTRKISGVKIEVDGYSVHGIKTDDQAYFKEKFHVYLAMDASRTPVEIIGGRGLIKVRMHLAEADLRALAAAEKLLVETVVPGSPAEEAGVQGGFIPAEIDGESIVLGGDLIVSIDTPTPCVGECLTQAPALFSDWGALPVTLLREGHLYHTTIEATPCESPSVLEIPEGLDQRRL